MDDTDYEDYVKPLPARLLKTLKLDKTFIRAEGNFLYYELGNNQIAKVVDFAGGYGSLLLGHNHPELVKEACNFLQTRVPIHGQMSKRSKTAELAKLLSREIGHFTGKTYVTTLTNSGAEAVEAAIKHARMAYFKKLDTYRNSLHESFNEIKNSLIRRGLNLDSPITSMGKKYHSWCEFKEQILIEFEQAINEINPIFLAAEGAFHGKTMGALSITHRDTFRKPFIPQNIDAQFFPLNNDDLQNIFGSFKRSIHIPKLTINNTIEMQSIPHCKIAGVFIEPILGEGGAIPVSVDILKKMENFCNENQVPLIIDEIQSGCYRSGDFLASTASGIKGDYYLLGKSLGGGIAKIAAMIVDKAHYNEEFGLAHTSTFSEDDFSSALSIKSLSLIKVQLKRIGSMGIMLHEQLQQLKQRFPEEIQSVSGRGLMLAVRFKSFHTSNSYGFQLLSRSGYLGYVCAGYLLNKWGIRVAPPLSDNVSIRIQPSLLITQSDVENLIRGLEDLCHVLYAEDLYKLIEYSLAEKEQNQRDLQYFKHGCIGEVTHEKAVDSVGFITHFIDIEGVKAADPSLDVVSDQAIETLLTQLLDISKPILLGQRIIKNSCQQEVRLILVGLCFTAAMVRKALTNKKSREFRQLCHEAVNFLVDHYKVSAVGLGQYTSILTQEGKTIPNSDVRITTGNSFTVSVGVRALLAEIQQRMNVLEPLKLAVVGAGGNISSTYAQIFSAYASEIVLLGGEQITSKKKAERTAGKIIRHVFQRIKKNVFPKSIIESKLEQSDLFISGKWKHCTLLKLWLELSKELKLQTPIKVIETIHEIGDCDAVVVATNSSEAFLKPTHIKENGIIYDISVPTNCGKEFTGNKKGIIVIHGGVVALPNAEVIPIKGFPLESGYTYACMADTLLLGFERSLQTRSFGSIDPEQVETMGHIGIKHGFSHILANSHTSL